jgi:hypothetical protein
MFNKKQSIGVTWNMNNSNGYFIFNGKEFNFIQSRSRCTMKSKEDYRSFNFLLSDEYKEDIKELLDISDEIVVFFKDKSKRTSVLNSMISIIYEETTIYGMFEVKFRTNIPIEEIREIKLKKLIND